MTATRFDFTKYSIHIRLGMMGAPTSRIWSKRTDAFAYSLETGDCACGVFFGAEVHLPRGSGPLANRFRLGIGVTVFLFERAPSAPLAVLPLRGRSGSWPWSMAEASAAAAEPSA
jgi:hypothetical protein